MQVDVHQEDDSSSSSSSSEEDDMDPEQKKYLVQLTGALSPKRPPGDRCLVQEVSERRRKKRLSELGCRKSLSAIPRGGGVHKKELNVHV